MSTKRILFLAQHYITLYCFRRELIERLCKEGHEVYLSLPVSEDNKYFEDIGCKIVPTEIDRRGVNPLNDIKLIRFYKKMIPEINPDIVFSYTIKPNVYGTIATNRIKKKDGTRYIQVCNITGTGGTFINDDLVAKICRMLYRCSVRKCYKVFFQNKGDRDMFIKNRMIKDNWDMLPGSGVNLEQFNFSPLPEGNDINFIFIGRVMKVKGIDEYLEAAKRVREKYKNAFFDIAGFIEEGEYKEKVESYGDAVIPLGFIKDITSEIKKCHCTILPSHGGEGVPNVLLESAAMGRICIGSKIPGTEDVIEDGKNGYLFEAGNVDSLVSAIEKVLKLSSEEKKEMGMAGRFKVEREFNREIVVQKYMDEVDKA
ncbi:MAG: glycosyltransferase family 4 protein [Lachnospiraceae bacterium]|nr:glycosyltransferase family 4 protein [Lachnospiraceae bacterium]